MNPFEYSAPAAANPGTPRRALVAVLMAIAAMAAVEATASADGAERLAEGKRLAMARGKGNCLACHAFDDGQLPGNLGPPLIYMKQRFPDRAALREQIWDATKRNPETLMPPFGRHRILSEREIDLIVDYIHTL